MNKILRTIRKNWIRVWLVVAVVLSLSVIATYAAFTEVQSVKRVVSTKASSQVSFSSNYLKDRAIEAERRIKADECEVKVVNYQYEKPIEWSDKDIAYTLTAWLEAKVGNERKAITKENIAEIRKTIVNLDDKISKYAVGKIKDNIQGELSGAMHKFLSENDYKIEITNNNLKTGNFNDDIFKVEFDQNAKKLSDAEIYVCVEAMANDSSIPPIKAALYTQQVGEEKSNWSGKITDDNYNNIEYDFYNYVITGSGDGIVTLLWNSEKIAINPFFYKSAELGYTFINDESTTETGEPKPADSELLGDNESSEEWKMLKIKVDPTVISRYELQIFKLAPEESYKNNIENYIKCIYSKTEANIEDSENDGQNGN